MKRPASAEDNLERIRRWRAICPDITHPQHLHRRAFPERRKPSSRSCSNFSDAAQLDRVGCFAYSPVEGAAANALPDHVPDALKEERRARFMKLQEDISARRLRRNVGKTMQVLVDERRAPAELSARSTADAPEIDGVVHVAGAAGLKAGEFAAVRVTRTDVHDMWAEVECQWLR